MNAPAAGRYRRKVTLPAGRYRVVVRAVTAAGGKSMPVTQNVRLEMSAANGNHDAPPEALAVAGPLREPEPARRRTPAGGGAHARGRSTLSGPCRR